MYYQLIIGTLIIYLSTITNVKITYPSAQQKCIHGSTHYIKCVILVLLKTACYFILRDFLNCLILTYLTPAEIKKV